MHIHMMRESLGITNQFSSFERTRVLLGGRTMFHEDWVPIINFYCYELLLMRSRAETWYQTTLDIR